MFKKIKWRRGMEITPQTFETMDNYHESMVDAVRRLAVSKSYGVIPGSVMNVTTTIVDEDVSIQIHSLEAISRSGKLFTIVGDTLSRQLPQSKGRECYIVVYRGGELVQEINGVLYSKPRYAYDYCTLEEIDSDSIPVSKLCLENGLWKVQELYIPPCMVLSSHPELMHIVEKCKRTVHSIVDVLINKHQLSDILPLRLLLIELDDVSGTETPEEFYLLLKKIAWTLSSLKVSGIEFPALPEFQPFINNNDILFPLMRLVLYFNQYESAVDKVVEKPKEEKKYEDIYVVLR